jgi:hypothetical protein
MTASLSVRTRAGRRLSDGQPCLAGKLAGAEDLFSGDLTGGASTKRLVQG